MRGKISNEANKANAEAELATASFIFTLINVILAVGTAIVLKRLELEGYDR